MDNTDLIEEFRKLYLPPPPAETPAASPAAGRLENSPLPAQDAPRSPTVAATGAPMGPPDPTLRPAPWSGSLPGSAAYAVDSPIGQLSLPKAGTEFALGAVGRAQDLVKRPLAWVAEKTGNPGTAEAVRGMELVRPSGLDRDAFAGKAGSFATDMGVASMAGSGLGKAVGMAGRSVGSYLPKLGGYLKAAGDAIASFGTHQVLPSAAPGAGALARGGAAIADMGTRMAGGAAAGAAGAAVVDPDNIGPAAAIGALAPPLTATAAAAGRGVANLVDPFLPGGAKRQAQRIVGNAAAYNPTTVESRIRQSMAHPNVAPPTTVEAARDPGISGLHRYLVDKDPAYAAQAGMREAAANRARFDSLQAAGGTQQAIDAARALRARVTDPMLAAVNRSTPVSTVGPMRVATQWGKTGDAMRPDIANQVAQSIRPLYDPAAKGIPRTVPLDNAWSARKAADAVISGTSGATPVGQAMKGVDVAAIKPTQAIRDSLDRALRKASTEFANYSDEYARLSKNVKGNEALFDVVKQVSRGVTKDDVPLLSSAKLDGVLKNMTKEVRRALTDDQYKALVNLRRELLRAEEAKMLGVGVGSNTAAKLQYGGSLPLKDRLLLGAFGSSNTGKLAQGALNVLSLGAEGRANTAIAGLLGDPSAYLAAAQQSYRPMAQFAPGMADDLARRLNLGLVLTPGLLAELGSQ
jgi:hypothetical protein